ncbi:MAG: Smr/MutS family protein [Pseudomonadota bacterium]
MSTEEQAAWARLAESVTPLSGRTRPAVAKASSGAASEAGKNTAPKPVGTARPASIKPKAHAPVTAPKPPPAARISDGPTGLDSHWDRRFKSGRIEPDLTLDLHGHTLDTAYARITAGLDQARAMGARVVLVIAGRERPVDPADRAGRRGAIRAKLLDWLAAGPHADHISAVRRAHRAHGGEGALYLILKRRR